MRKLLAVALSVSAFALGVWHADVAALQERFNLKVLASNGKAAANLPVVFRSGGTETPIGTTTDAGDVAVALDPSKNGKSFNVYREACTKLVITQEELPCDDERLPEGCKKCEKLGTFIFGTNATVGSAGMSTPMKITLFGVAPAAITGAVVATNNGANSTVGANPTTQPGPQTAFTANAAPVTINVTSLLRGCNLFQPTYTAPGTFTVTNGPNMLTVVINDPGASQTLTGSANFGTAAGLQANVATFAPFAWTSATGRNVETSGSNGTFQANGSGSFTLVHTYRGGGTAGPPPNCQDTYNAVVTPR